MNIQRRLEPVIIQKNEPIKDDYNRYQDNFIDDHMSQVAIYTLTGGITVNLNLLVHESTHQGLSPDKGISKGMRIVTDHGLYYVDDSDPAGRMNQLALKRIEALNER